MRSCPVGRTLCVQIAHPPWRARPVALQGPLTPAGLGCRSTCEPASAQLCEDVEVVVEHVAMPAEDCRGAAARPGLVSLARVFAERAATDF